jgi:flagella basal body P-ring formation protein FlgA
MMVRSIAFFMAIWFVASPSLAGGEITLRRAARIADGKSVTLADVARLGEDELARIGAIELDLPESTGSAVRVGLDDVIAALRGAGEDPARYAMSGSTCVVRRSVGARSRPEASVEEEESWRPPESVDSFHGRIVGWLAESYGVDRADLRVEWQERDRSFLERRDGGVGMALELISSPGAPRAAISVRLRAGDAIVEERTIRADVSVRRAMVVVTSGVRRGDRIGRGDVTRRVEFARPGGDGAVGSLEEVVGMVAKTRLDVGDVLRAGDFEPPVLVERGQMVVVYCVRGTIEVRLRARAKEDGVKGQTIEIEKPGSREAMYARVDGPGLVTVGAGIDRTQDERVMR